MPPCSPKVEMHFSFFWNGQKREMYLKFWDRGSINLALVNNIVLWALYCYKTCEALILCPVLLPAKNYYK